MSQWKWIRPQTGIRPPASGRLLWAGVNPFPGAELVREMRRGDIGFLTGPSLRFDRPGIWRGYAGIWGPGTGRFSVWVRQDPPTVPRPYLRVKAHPIWGATDLVVPAAVQAGWVRIVTPVLTFVTSGVVELELGVPEINVWDARPCWFDSLVFEPVS